MLKIFGIGMVLISKRKTKNKKNMNKLKSIIIVAGFIVIFFSMNVCRAQTAIATNVYPFSILVGSKSIHSGCPGTFYGIANSPNWISEPTNALGGILSTTDTNGVSSFQTGNVVTTINGGSYCNTNNVTFDVNSTVGYSIKYSIYLKSLPAGIVKGDTVNGYVSIVWYN